MTHTRALETGSLRGTDTPLGAYIRKKTPAGMVILPENWLFHARSRQ
jgi:hypothetical protein